MPVLCARLIGPQMSIRSRLVKETRRQALAVTWLLSLAREGKIERPVIQLH